MAILLAVLSFFGFPSLLDKVSDMRLKEIWIAIMQVSFIYYFWGILKTFFWSLGFLGCFFFGFPSLQESDTAEIAIDMDCNDVHLIFLAH